MLNNVVLQDRVLLSLKWAILVVTVTVHLIIIWPWVSWSGVLSGHLRAVFNHVVWGRTKETISLVSVIRILSPLLIIATGQLMC